MCEAELLMREDFESCGVFSRRLVGNETSSKFPVAFRKDTNTLGSLYPSNSAKRIYTHKEYKALQNIYLYQTTKTPTSKIILDQTY